MFGISLPELLVIFTVVLLVFGPDKLPELAKNLGKLLGQLRKQTDGVRREFYNAVYTPLDTAKNRLDTELRSIKNLDFEQQPSAEQKASDNSNTQTAAPKAEGKNDA